MKKPIINIVYYCIFIIFINSMSYGAEIHKAAVNCDLSKLKQFIKKGIDINSYDTEPGSDYEYPKGTPLHWAVRADQKEAVLFLIKNGADINAKTDDGVSLMVETPLDYAVWQRNLELAKILLHAGANVEGACHKFHWPLLAAIVNEDFKMAKLLLDYGADLYKTGSDDYTVLHMAVLKHKINSVKYLLSIGFNVNAPGFGTDGGTALHVTVRREDIEIAKILIEHNADLNIIDYKGYTPLTLAVEKNEENFIKLFIEKGANVNECGSHLTESGNYLPENNPLNAPLHIAVKMGNLNYINLLLKAGANVNLKNRNGETPIDIAQEYGSSDIVKLLTGTNGKIGVSP